MIDDGEFSEHESESAIWITLADLMTGLTAIFLVMCLMVLTNQNRKQVVIITAVTEQLENAAIEVVTDAKTGDVSIVNRDLLFGSGSAVLTAEGKQFLNRFVPQYSQAIFSLDPKISDEIVRIVVEGRTSRSGDPASNMSLSLQRANAVVQYIYGMNWFPKKDEMLPRLTPVGRGVMEAKSYEDHKDREVLFRFQFKGELLDREKNAEQFVEDVAAAQKTDDGVVDEFVQEEKNAENKLVGSFLTQFKGQTE